jgi:hypothetical protein
MLGSNNNINILDRSLIANDMIRGLFHDLGFIVNGKEYPCYHLLADGIYPPLSCFVQANHQPGNKKRAHFRKMQEVVQKDVEWAFGVLQTKFAITANPLKLWNMDTMKNIMQAYIILNNMIIEDERLKDHFKPLFESRVVVQLRRGLTFKNLVAGTIELENLDSHYSLRGDLIKHL